MHIFKPGWAIPVKSHVWKFGSDWLSLSRVIIWIFRLGGGGRNHLLGGYKWPAMYIFELGWAIPVKSHVWKFDPDWSSLSRVIVSTNIFPAGGGGQKPQLGGLHLTSDAHFRTQMSYSSQKSCAKIWFGLVEIGGMLMLRGVTCDLLCPFSNLAKLFQLKVTCENLVLIIWAYQEYIMLTNKQTKIKQNK